MKLADVKKVAVVGTGLMGHGIAQTFALAGYPVALYDADPQRVDSAAAGIKSNLDLFVANGVCTQAEADAALARITPHKDMKAAVGDVDFLMEAVFENVKVKQEVLAQLDKVCPERTVFASNTSGLSVDELGPATNRPDRVVVAHFWNPPHIIPLVEVVKGKLTSDETVELTADILRKIGREPVVLSRHIDGFIGNRLQYAMFREAVALVQSGIATPEDVDKVVKLSLGRRYVTVGPLETADINGLALFHQIASYLYKDLDAATEPHPVHTNLVNEGNTGVKSGRGFYTWADGKAEAALKRRDAELIRWMKLDKGLEK